MWTSPPGCLMFSFNTRYAPPASPVLLHALTSVCLRSLHDAASLPLLQYVVTLAVVQAVQELAQASLHCDSHTPLDVRIKWPNDVYAAGAKLGGVLCGSSYADGAFCVTVGVGLNLDNQQPTTSVNALLAAAAPAAPPPPLRREALLACILERYEALEALFVAQKGFGGDLLQGAYLCHWLHSGQAVRLQREDGGEEEVTVRGLAPSGYLLAVDAEGAESELHPDGNSLDFWKGLIRRKLR